MVHGSPKNCQNLPECLTPLFFNCGHVGSILYIWWEFPKIRGLSNRIFHTIRKITGLPIRKSSQFTLLNFPCPGAPKLVQRLIMFILLGAKLTIAKAWKQLTVSFLLVKGKISWIMVQEKTVSILLNTADKHEATWESWSRYLSLPPIAFLTPGTM